MKIHEYQAKQLLRRHGMPVQRGKVASTPEEARAIAQDLQAQEVVLKAQFMRCGRGKAGGIRLVHTLEEAETTARQMLGMRLMTPQTRSKRKNRPSAAGCRGSENRTRTLRRHCPGARQQSFGDDGQHRGEWKSKRRQRYRRKRS
jgi:hypothetical protein